MAVVPNTLQLRKTKPAEMDGVRYLPSSLKRFCFNLKRHEETGTILYKQVWFCSHSYVLVAVSLYEVKQESKELHCVMWEVL